MNNEEDPIMQLVALAIANWKVLSIFFGGLIAIILSDALTKWELYRLKSDFKEFKKLERVKKIEEKVEDIENRIEKIDKDVILLESEVIHTKDRTNETIGRLDTAIEKITKLLFTPRK